MMIPSLIEPTTRYFLQEKLRECHNVRANIYSTIINVSVIVFFVGFLSFIIYTIYTNKPTEEQLREQNLINQHLIMNKIKEFRTVPAKVSTLVDDNMNFARF